MRIIVEYPPNIDKIAKTFPLKGREIFAYGNIIYNPSGAYIGPELVAHETVHKNQQGDDVEGWWDKYLSDDGFRRDMETEAHIAEWLVLKGLIKDRNDQVRACAKIATKLSAPLYGKVISYRKAMDILRKAN